MHRRQQSGFTALELMVAMAITAILLGASIPAFKNYSWNLRMKTAMHGLRTDLNLARSRAISLGTQTIICPIAAISTGKAGNAVDCSAGSNWHTGWMVFADLNGDRQRQLTETVLSQAAATSFVTIRSSSARKKLRFSPNGSAPGSNATITFCDQRGSSYARAIKVSNTGRIRLMARASNNKVICP